MNSHNFSCYLRVNCVLRLMILLVGALAFSTAPASAANPTNAILFVTQVPIPADFTTIASVFGNHRADLQSAGRGGDLFIRYPDGTSKNLTRAAGFGRTGLQATNGIAVRNPCVHWSGGKAVFSMVVGSPTRQFDYAAYYWQLYEITGLGQKETPVITKVPNQPVNFNNVSPIYGTDERILFTSDRPRNGQRHLYPQLDEYEEAPTVTGLWSLDPATGDLFLLNHSPSGVFSPGIDSFGRVIFTRWDHLQRDQQADSGGYGTFNYSDESANALVLTNDSTEIFPEPRSASINPITGTPLQGHTFNQFFPWQINEDGTEEETLNHVGRHEMEGYIPASFADDPNLQDFYNPAARFNTNRIENFLQIQEDPRNPGTFFGIDAPEFYTHAAGQLIAINGAPNVNPDQMRITYLTPRSTASYTNGVSSPPADHTGFYRNPLPMTDGTLVAVHTGAKSLDRNQGTTVNPISLYDFRLKTLKQANGYWVPDELLTPGITNAVSYYDPDTLVSYSGAMWELDPVEVCARARPARVTPPLAVPEQKVFADEGVEVAALQNYLRLNQLALIVSRNVTTRDHADRQQPFNLRVAGTATQTMGAAGKVYDIEYLQLFQADQIRGLTFGGSTPRAGRRVLAQQMHEPVIDNSPNPTGPAASVKLGTDGSMAAFVPARRAMTWHLTDSNGGSVVKERYWLTFQPGEIRVCTSCHGLNTRDQANHPTPTNSPLALANLLRYWKKQNTPTVGVQTNGNTNYLAIAFKRQLAATNLTHTVEVSEDLKTWFAGSRYSVNSVLSNSTFTTQVSRTGTNIESIVVRDNTPLEAAPRRFMRVRVSQP
jgi:hypothetical protein